MQAQDTSSAKLPHWRNHVIPLGILALVVLIAYPAWCMPGVYGFDDLGRLNVPQRILLAWFYLNGHWPLWNPFSFGGQPFLAAGQSGPLYLPNVLFLLFPTVPAVKISYLVHEWLAVFGTYAAAWHVSKSRAGGVVAAISFGTCGFLVGHQIHTQMFDAMCWLPLIFWLCLSVLESVSILRVAALSVAMAMEAYAGHPQVTFYICLFLCLFVVLCWIRKPSKQAFVRSVAVVAAIVYSFALAAAQWLPTLEFVGYSSRGKVTPDFLLSLSLPAPGLMQFLTPYGAGGEPGSSPMTRDSFLSVYGSSLFWEFTCYAGIIVLVLAVAVSLVRIVKSRTVFALAVIAVLSICLALGANGFLSDVLVYVPGFNMFRVPARYVGMADFSIALLSAIGISAIQSAYHRDVKRMRSAVVAVAILAGLGLYVGKRVVPLSGFSWAAFSVTVSLLCLLCIVLFTVAKRSQSAAAWILACLVMADSVSQSTVLSTFVLVPAKSTYADPPSTVKYVQQHLSGSDPFTRAADFNAGDLSQDKSAASLIPALNGYDSLDANWYDHTVALTWNADAIISQPRSLLDAFGIRYVLTPADEHPMIPTASKGVPQWSHWVNLPEGTKELTLHVTSVAGEPLVSGPLCSVTLSAGNAVVTKWIRGWTDTYYAIPLPSNWPVHQATLVTIQNELWTSAVRVEDVGVVAASGGENESIPVHVTLAPSPWKQAYSDGHTTVWENPDSLSSAWVTPDGRAPFVHGAAQPALAAWSPNRQVWDVTQSTGGMFVISQLYDPNWHATVDGHPVPVERVGPGSDNILTGIPIAKGKHHIVLTYSPRAFNIGLCVTLLSLVLLIALSVRSAVKKGKGRSH